MAAQTAVHDDPTFVAGDDLDDERAARLDEDDEDEEGEERVEDAEDEHSLVDGSAALGCPADLPRLKVIARSGRAVSQAVSQMDALENANHHRNHHRPDDEEGVGDDDTE